MTKRMLSLLNSAWLDEQFYCGQMRPRLFTIRVSTTESTLSISEPLTLRIRGARMQSCGELHRAAEPLFTAGRYCTKR
jgi:hypothetical protein